MLCRRFLALVFILLTFSKISAQVKTDSDCIDWNNAILGQEFINTFGKKFVVEILEKNIYFGISLSVDSTGRVLTLRNSGPKQKLDKSQSSLLERNLIKKKYHFFICFERFPNYSISESNKIISKDLFKNVQSCFISVSFPGNYMMYYEIEKRKLNTKGKVLSKYDYLINQIKKYTHNISY